MWTPRRKDPFGERRPDPRGGTLPGRRLLAALLGCGGLALGVGPSSAEPVLHEHFEPDPEEDLRWGATTPSGSFPAALHTPSGVVRAPDESQRFSPSATRGGSTYGGARTPTSVDATYHVDRLTTAPTEVAYDEPFRPSVLPFKRLYAFDSVKGDLSLGVREEALTLVRVGGQVEAGEDAFFGDFEVDLVPFVPVRVPTVGSATRLLSISVDPKVTVEVLEDGAENWFVRSNQGGRVRVVVQLSAPRAPWDKHLEQVSWSSLEAPFTRLPESARPYVERVLHALRFDRGEAPSVVLRRMIDHFRGFSASEELPRATSPGELYVELSLSQKGVCRHRAYAFLLTAFGLGLPARLVHNEAHAWVEVADGAVWHRVDLGGAPAELRETRPDPGVPAYRFPADPFSWPAGSQSGARLAAASSSASAGSAPWPSALGSGVAPRSGALGSQGASEPSGRGASVRLELGESSLRRGGALGVRGAASLEGKPCSLARIDLFLETESGAWPLGSVATDRQGRFDGQITLPADLPAGSHSVRGRVGAGCD